MRSEVLTTLFLRRKPPLTTILSNFEGTKGTGRFFVFAWVGEACCRRHQKTKGLHGGFWREGNADCLKETFPAVITLTVLSAIVDLS